MRRRDERLDDLGAEALPAGLREINAISRPGDAGTTPARTQAAPAARASLLGLLSRWLSRAARGR